MATIVKLPDSTIQTIAAGEVITRPVNVVKELLENCIDAGSTNIIVTIQKSGMKLIDIVDNGTGIARANAELLCGRYTTSKLSCADDLSRISTFGFRGEALSSISEMAQVEVRSFNMTTDVKGWTAKYKNGRPIEEPVEKYLVRAGTQIKIRKLFSDIQQRRLAMKSSLADEKKSIEDLVKYYSMHFRKSITTSLKERDAGRDILCLIAPMAIGPCIGSYFGEEMEKNLIEFEVDWDSRFHAEVFFTYKKTSSSRSSKFILFVNNRLVECNDLKREIDALIKEHLNSKQNTALIYIDLKVPTQDVDVNAHPAKATVILHYHVDIVAMLVDRLRSRLKESLTTQPVKLGTQKLLSQLIKSSSSQQVTKKEADRPFEQTQENYESRPAAMKELPTSSSTVTNSVSTAKRQYDLVHNDHSQQSLAQLKGAIKTKPKERTKRKSGECIEPWPGIEVLSNTSRQRTATPEIIVPSKRTKKLLISDDECDESTYHRRSSCHSPPLAGPSRPRRDLRLRSVAELKRQVTRESSLTSSSTIKNSTFVGIFDHDRALIQHETKLFAINLKAYLKEQFYQFYLYDFGNFPLIEVLPPGNKITLIIDTYLEDVYKHDATRFHKLKFNTSNSVIDELEKHSTMFEDYLSLKLTREEIVTLPCIIQGEVPNLTFLGKFLVELANNVNYNEERECIRLMGRVLADFYSEAPANLKDREVHRRYHELIETELYVAIKKYLVIPEWLFQKENIVQISDTKDLYKVFERC